jgi:hypothetical protein
MTEHHDQTAAAALYELAALAPTSEQAIGDIQAWLSQHQLATEAHVANLRARIRELETALSVTPATPKETFQQAADFIMNYDEIAEAMAEEGSDD